MSPATSIGVDRAPPGPSQLAAFLRSTHVGGLGLADRLKISYRPYICPFGALLALIRPQDHVFDVGCGSGQFCLLAARFRRPARVSGIEISPRLIGNADALFTHAGVTTPHAFSVYDGTAFPASLGEADTVFLIDVLHHVPPSAQTVFIRTLYEAMRPGARLIVKDIDAASRLVVFNRLHDLVFSGETGRELSAGAFALIARDAGFDVQTMHHQTMWLYPHYLCVLTKPSATPSAHP